MRREEKRLEKMFRERREEERREGVRNCKNSLKKAIMEWLKLDWLSSL